MGIKRIVDTSFWTDGKVDEFTPEDKYFMLYLLTNPFSKQLGIYEISIKQAAFQMGYSVEAVASLIDRFENKYHIIRFSKETNEIAIINFLRHSVIKGGKPVEDCIKQDMARVKNKELIEFVFLRLRGIDGLNATVNKILKEYFNDNDKHNDNDNDNDNDRSGDVSSNDTPYDTSIKHQHGEYKHVFLTDSEEEKLIEEYGVDVTARAIIFLDEYIEEKKDYQSDSHYCSIRRWVINAVKEQEAKIKKNGDARHPRYGNFDVNEAFRHSLERTYSGGQ